MDFIARERRHCTSRQLLPHFQYPCAADKRAPIFSTRALCTERRHDVRRKCSVFLLYRFMKINFRDTFSLERTILVLRSVLSCGRKRKGVLYLHFTSVKETCSVTKENLKIHPRLFRQVFLKISIKKDTRKRKVFENCLESCHIFSVCPKKKTVCE